MPVRVAALVAAVAAVLPASAETPLPAPTDVVQFARPLFMTHEQVSNATVVIERRNPTPTAITVSFATADGTATAVNDYLAQTGSIVFSNGQSRAVLTIPVVDDSSVEPSETFNVTLTGVSAGATLGTLKTARVVIKDNDKAGHVQFSSRFYRVSETGGVATVTVVRTGGKASGVMVGYSTSDGSATATKDYTAATGTLTFGAGETQKTFTVPILPDSLTERVESVNLRLLSLSGTRIIGKRTAQILIYEGAVPAPRLDDADDDDDDDEGNGNGGIGKGKGKGNGKVKGPKGDDDDEDEEEDSADDDGGK